MLSNPRLNISRRLHGGSAGSCQIQAAKEDAEIRQVVVTTLPPESRQAPVQSKTGGLLYVVDCRRSSQSRTGSRNSRCTAQRASPLHAEIAYQLSLEMANWYVYVVRLEDPSSARAESDRQEQASHPKAHRAKRTTLLAGEPLRMAF